VLTPREERVYMVIQNRNLTMYRFEGAVLIEKEETRIVATSADAKPST